MGVAATLPEFSEGTLNFRFHGLTGIAPTLQWHCSKRIYVAGTQDDFRSSGSTLDFIITEHR